VHALLRRSGNSKRLSYTEPEASPISRHTSANPQPWLGNKFEDGLPRRCRRRRRLRLPTIGSLFQVVSAPNPLGSSRITNCNGNYISDVRGDCDSLRLTIASEPKTHPLPLIRSTSPIFDSSPATALVPVSKATPASAAVGSSFISSGPVSRLLPPTGEPPTVHRANRRDSNKGLSKSTPTKSAAPPRTGPKSGVPLQLDSLLPPYQRVLWAFPEKVLSAVTVFCSTARDMVL
jgi:hypothetical protein